MLLRQLFLLIALTLSVTTLQATQSQSNCGPGTFRNYMNMSGGCWLGPVLIKNFELFSFVNDNEPTAFADVDTILVTPQELPNGDVKLAITGFTDYVAAASETLTFQLFFTIDPPPIIAGEQVELDPPFGTIDLKHAYCYDSLFLIGADQCDTYPEPTPAMLGDGGLDGAVPTPVQLFFNSPAFMLDTRTSVILNPGKTESSGFDGLIFTVDIAEPAPEPATSALAGLGLAGALFARRRFRRQSRKQ